MRIVIILLCASFISADNIESKYSSFLMGKLDDQQSAENSSFRFTASLRFDGKHICTTTLLSNKHAITTASCLKDFLNEPEIPNFDLYSVVTRRSDVVFSLEAVFAHRRYSFLNPKSQFNMGLIRFKDNNITESEYVGWAIPPVKREPIYELVQVTTWQGSNQAIETGEENHPVLKRAPLKILDNRKCNIRLDTFIICAEVIDMDQIFTNDDIGAPMSMGQFIVGILSVLPENKRPAVFVDVLKAHTAIDRFMHDNRPYTRVALPRKKAWCDLVFSYNTLNRNTKAKYQ